ncbi:hypothetical protein [Streptomyces mirabilis]|uniref:hypothetical protein n=1 Tax=Streptomyces mirabilis TaxID=68239 RepID=UPI0006CCBFBA|nr:hypothetical protein [Streptomyces mirabilis]KPI21955.1 hypothetical protein OK006_9154 [Actinobacteria bacterium OK006]MCX4427098.1 hypothetical protein [Streptomyces mirabilis]
MAEGERQLREQHQAMIRDLGDRYTRIKQCGPDDAVFDEQYDQLVACAERLLEFERMLPARLAQPKRERADRVVKWSWRGQTVVAVALIAAVLALGHTAWWLVLLIPHLLGTLMGWSVTVTAERYREQRAIVIGLHVLCLLVVLVALGVISAWWIVAVLVGWVAVGAASEGSSQQGAK